MAGPTTVYRISTVIEGEEKVAALKQTIKLLGSTSSTSSDAVSQLRQQALELGRASTASTKDIRTAVDALKGLKDVVSLTSDDYKVLSGDIQSIGSRLDSATGSVTRHTQAQVKLGQVVNANSRAVNNYFSNAAVRQQEQLNQRIQQQLRTPTLALPAAGQSSFQGAVDASGFGGGARRGTGVKESPFEIGSDPSSKQRYMGAPRSDSEVSAAAGYLERDAAAANSAATAANKYKSEIEQLYNSIRKYQGQQVANKNQQVAYSYRELTEEITRVTASSNGSLNSLRQQRQLWEQLYNAVEKTDPAYARARANMQRLDKDISSRTPGGQNRLQRFGQSAGAIAASGVFGGPEGVIGSGIGSFFGPGAALAGGAIGAQVGMGRKQLGEMATYAADLDKQRIALKLIIKDTDSYNSALTFLNKTSEQYAIPQDRLIKGFTQVAASVIGAGGNIQDAKTAFEGITSGIRGTGRSLDDLDGALLATAQVFSKGKVSAEELRGQIGERLPGAYNLFAKALGRTPQELDKALERGEVTLADFMKFSKQVFKEYSENAKTIAASDAAAGDRLTKTWKAVSEQIGKALLPVGAQIQNSLGSLLKELTPTFIGLAQGLASAVKLIADNFGAIANIVKFTAAIAAAQVALSLFAGGGLALVIFDLKLLIAPLLAAAKAQWALNVAVLANPYVAAAAGLAALAVAAYNLNKPFRDFVDTIPAQMQAFFSSLASDAVTTFAKVSNEAEYAFKQISNEAEFRSKLIREKFSPLTSFFEDLGLKIAAAFTGSFGSIDNKFGLLIDSLLSQLNPWLDVLKLIPGLDIGGSIDKARQAASDAAEYQKASSTGMYGKYLPGSSQVRFAPKKEDDSSGLDSAPTAGVDKAAKAAEDLAAKQRRLDEEIAKGQIRFADTVFNYQIELDRKRYELNKELIDLQRNNYVNSFTGIRKEIAAASVEFKNSLEGLDLQKADATIAVRRAQQEFVSAQATAAATAAGTVVMGSNMKRGFTGNSVAGFPITDRPGYSAWRGREHGGFDVGTPMGTPLGYSMGGKVLSNKTLGGYGKTLEVELDNGVIAFSAHLNKVLVEAGQRFTAGQILANTGNTGGGLNTGPHLHQEGKRGGDPSASLPYLMLGGKQSGVSVAQGKGKPQQQLRNVKAESTASVEALGINQASALQAEIDKIDPQKRAELYQQYSQRITGSIKEQVQALRDEADMTQSLNRLRLEGVRPELIQQEEQLLKIAKNQSDSLAQLGEDKKAGLIDEQQYKEQIVSQTEAYANWAQGIKDATAAQIAFNDALRVRQDFDIGGGFKEAAVKYIESIGTLKDATTQLALDGFKGLEDSIFSLFTTGSANFKEFASGILKATARMIIQQLILRTIMQAIGSIGGGGSSGLGSVAENLNKYAPLANANGNVFANGIQPFAKGGIVNNPTIFKYASGGAFQTGLMGEAGPEAVVPLKRGKDGKLGISGGGGVVNNVSVSVDASGSPQVSGNAGQGQQLGRAIAAAVQAELVKQKRPGGILA